jgi:hypothetical protein
LFSIVANNPVYTGTCYQLALIWWREGFAVVLPFLNAFSKAPVMDGGDPDRPIAATLSSGRHRTYAVVEKDEPNEAATRLEITSRASSPTNHHAA